MRFGLNFRLGLWVTIFLLAGDIMSNQYDHFLVGFIPVIVELGHDAVRWIGSQLSGEMSSALVRHYVKTSRKGLTQ